MNAPSSPAGSRSRAAPARKSFLRYRTIVGSVALAALLASGPKLLAADPTIEDIARALQDWKQSWVTLRFKYEDRNPVQLRRSTKSPKIKRAESLDGFFHLHEWSFAGDGSQWHQVRVFRDGAPANSTVTVTRARDSLYVDALSLRKPDGSDFLNTLTLTTYNPPVADRSEMACFRTASPVHAFYNMRKSEWLGDTLEQGAGVLEEFEELDGVRCARVKVGHVAIWFDLEHGILPRRSDDSPGAGGDMWSTSEWQLLSNGKWFPKRGTVWTKSDPHDETAEWLVTVSRSAMGR